MTTEASWSYVVLITGTVDWIHHQRPLLINSLNKTREFQHQRRVRLRVRDLKASSKEHAQSLKSRTADSWNDDFELKSP